MFNQPEKINQSSLAPSSKRISKQPISPASSVSSPNKKKYLILPESQRRLLLSELKVLMLRTLNKDLHEDDIDRQCFLDMIEEMGKPQYKALIRQVLSVHGTDSDFSTSRLALWQKKIIKWVEGLDKPETRGGVVVRDDQLVTFTEQVLNILDGMHTRCFNTLRSRILPILPPAPSGRATSRKTNDDRCSAHWWFDIRKKNPEIAKKWDSLPRTKGKAGSPNHTSTTSKAKKYRKTSTSDFSDHGHASTEVSTSSPSNEISTPEAEMNLEGANDFPVFSGDALGFFQTDNAFNSGIPEELSNKNMSAEMFAEQFFAFNNGDALIEPKSPYMSFNQEDETNVGNNTLTDFNFQLGNLNPTNDLNTSFYNFPPQDNFAKLTKQVSTNSLFPTYGDWFLPQQSLTEENRRDLIFDFFEF